MTDRLLRDLGRTRHNAGRINHAGGSLTDTHIAFLHLSILPVLRHPEGTCLAACFAADAFLTVHHDNSVFRAFVDGILGTGIHTGGLGAMHARNGDRLALYIRVGTDPDILDTPIFHSQFNIPPAFAGNFTPVTLEAIFLYIYKPELLIYHAASPSSSSFKPSSPLPASDCSLP